MLLKPQAFPGFPRDALGITRDNQGNLRKPQSPGDWGGVSLEPGIFGLPRYPWLSEGKLDEPGPPNLFPDDYRAGTSG